VENNNNGETVLRCTQKTNQQCAQGQTKFYLSAGLGLMVNEFLVNSDELFICDCQHANCRCAMQA